MYKLIKQLLFIEENASIASAPAQRERDGLQSRIEEMRLEIGVRISEETELRIMEMQSTLLKEAEAKIAEIELHTRKQSEIIEKLFEDNRHKWEDDIFGEMIS